MGRKLVFAKRSDQGFRSPSGRVYRSEERLEAGPANRDFLAADRTAADVIFQLAKRFVGDRFSRKVSAELGLDDLALNGFYRHC
jgi:hypothetical protein